jgi:hypothetical protein
MRQIIRLDELSYTIRVKIGSYREGHTWRIAARGRSGTEHHDAVFIMKLPENQLGEVEV